MIEVEISKAVLLTSVSQRNVKQTCFFFPKFVDEERKNSERWHD